MLHVTLGNVAPLEPDGSAAEVGETFTYFEFVTDDRDECVTHVLDAWPRHSSADPSWVQGDVELCERLRMAWPDVEVR